MGAAPFFESSIGIFCDAECERTIFRIGCMDAVNVLTENLEAPPFLELIFVLWPILLCELLE
jgi:hypothetical protein